MVMARDGGMKPISTQPHIGGGRCWEPPQILFPPLGVGSQTLGFTPSDGSEQGSPVGSQP